MDDLVAQDHLVRIIEDGIDFTYLYPRVKNRCGSTGRASIVPVILFKLLLINILFGINSTRKTCKECKVNLAYRWFLRLEIDEEIPNYSTWSQKYIRRYKDSNIFNEIFDCILSQSMMNGFVDMAKKYPGNVHDSTAFFEVHDEMNKKYPGMIQNIALGAEYKSPTIC